MLNRTCQKYNLSQCTHTLRAQPPLLTSESNFPRPIMSVRALVRVHYYLFTLCKGGPKIAKYLDGGANFPWQVLHCRLEMHAGLSPHLFSHRTCLDVSTCEVIHGSLFFTVIHSIYLRFLQWVPQSIPTRL